MKALHVLGRGLDVLGQHSKHPSARRRVLEAGCAHALLRPQPASRSPTQSSGQPLFLLSLSPSAKSPQHHCSRQFTWGTPKPHSQVTAGLRQEAEASCSCAAVPCHRGDHTGSKMNMRLVIKLHYEYFPWHIFRFVHCIFSLSLQATVDFSFINLSIARFFSLSIPRACTTHGTL